MALTGITTERKKVDLLTLHYTYVGCYLFAGVFRYASSTAKKDEPKSSSSSHMYQHSNSD